MVQNIAYDASGRQPTRDFPEALVQPDLELVDQGFGLNLAGGLPFVRRPTADVSFDGVELGDSPERF